MMLPQQLEGVAQDRMRDWEKELEHLSLVAQLQRSQSAKVGWPSAIAAKIGAIYGQGVAALRKGSSWNRTIAAQKS